MLSRVSFPEQAEVVLPTALPELSEGGGATNRCWGIGGLWPLLPRVRLGGLDLFPLTVAFSSLRRDFDASVASWSPLV